MKTSAPLPPDRMSAVAACSDPTPSGYQGYVEGEFVNVASPIAGRLDELFVKRGDNVAINARLYALEAVSEAAEAQTDEIQMWMRALANPSSVIRRQAQRRLKALTGRDYDLK